MRDHVCRIPLCGPRWRLEGWLAVPVWMVAARRPPSSPHSSFLSPAVLFGANDLVDDSLKEMLIDEDDLLLDEDR